MVHLGLAVVVILLELLNVVEAVFDFFAERGGFGFDLCGDLFEVRDFFCFDFGRHSFVR